MLIHPERNARTIRFKLRSERDEWHPLHGRPDNVRSLNDAVALLLGKLHEEQGQVMHKCSPVPSPILGEALLEGEEAEYCGEREAH